jgi:uncharacterized protein
VNRIQNILISAIKKYQKFLSPDHSDHAHDHVPYCKYYPSCSQYSIEAIEKKWAFLGSIKAFWRILRCQPWSKWWYDPVEKETINEEKK